MGVCGAIWLDRENIASCRSVSIGPFACSFQLLQFPSPYQMDFVFHVSQRSIFLFLDIHQGGWCVFRRHRLRTSEATQYAGLRVSYDLRHSFPPSTAVAVHHNKDMSVSFHILSHSLFTGIAHLTLCSSHLLTPYLRNWNPPSSRIWFHFCVSYVT